MIAFCTIHEDSVMAKRPPQKDPNAPAKAPRARQAKTLASVPPPVDSATDAPELIASETPPPDRILAGSPDGGSMELASSAAATIPSALSTSPTEEEIRTLAYERFLARGAGHGRDFEDWLEAENELKNR
jgi:hypothetical protein